MRLRDLEKEFKPGYKIGPARKTGFYTIVDAHDQPVRSKKGVPITIALDWAATYHGQRRIRQYLEDAGVLEKHHPKRRREAHERHTATKPSPKVNDHINPLLLASDTLSNPRASERERKLAKELIAQVEKTEKVLDASRIIAAKLGEANQVIATLERASAGSSPKL